METRAIKNGIKPTKKDHRDLSFPKTFGAVSISLSFPEEYNVDAGLTIPDQNMDGRPYGCSGYTQSELCQDEDGVKYNPGFTYDKTRMMEGTYPQDVGCSIRDSLKSTIVYGVEADGEVGDKQAFNHHRGQYFNVEPTVDFFDGIRSALWLGRLDKRSVSVGTPWYAIWMGQGPSRIAEDGFAPLPVDFNSNYSWHNYKVCGWRTINGVPYLIIKPWCGSTFGNKGYCYFSRELVNQLMAVDGSAAFTLGKADPQNIQLVELSVLETIVSYLRMLWRHTLGAIFI